MFLCRSFNSAATEAKHLEFTVNKEKHTTVSKLVLIIQFFNYFFQITNCAFLAFVSNVFIDRLTNCTKSKNLEDTCLEGCQVSQ